MDHFTTLEGGSAYRKDAAHMVIEALTLNRLRPDLVVLAIDQYTSIAFALGKADFDVEDKIVVNVQSTQATARLSNGRHHSILNLEDCLILR